METKKLESVLFNAIENLTQTFYTSENFPYMAINGGYELPFQTALGKELQDALGQGYWTFTNKGYIDILIKKINNHTQKDILAIEVGHYQLQQPFSGVKKIDDDLFNKKLSKFSTEVFHVFLLTDLVHNDENSVAEITKYGVNRRSDFADYIRDVETYLRQPKCQGASLKVYKGVSKEYAGFLVNYHILVTGPFMLG